MNNRKFNIITAIAVCMSILVCFAFLLMPKGVVKSTSASINAAYAEKLFGNDIIEINIAMDKEDWQNMLDNAASESYVTCGVTINGTVFSSVGLRPKGNSSLSMVANSNSDRFSFKIKFDEYVKGQKCFGLDKLVLNNMQADYTYMKEYISYYLMNFMGVDSPLVSYAHITVNGEEWGLYLAIESYDESYLERMYNTSEGNLYNVKKDMGGDQGGGRVGGIQQGQDEGQQDGSLQNSNQEKRMGGGQGGGPMGRNQQGQDGSRENSNQSGRTGGGRMGGFGGMDASNGGSLVYTDDNSSNYSSIFNNAIFNKSDEDDFQRVIKALKKLSTSEELEKYFDVDQLLRYFAVHTTVVNLDSYVSSMQQNYYIYEKDGRIKILPWDYNLAFGGFQSGEASAVVNFAIDTPVSGVDLSQRPLIAKLLENPEYKAKYHKYLKQVADYLYSEKFTEQVAGLENLISPYVEKDATKFCTLEQYKSAGETFVKLCKLRAESVKGQLDGMIPSTTAEQSGSTALVNADAINLNNLGSQGGGGFGMGRDMGGGMGGPGDRNSGASTDMQNIPYMQKPPDGQNPPGGRNQPDMPN